MITSNDMRRNNWMFREVRQIIESMFIAFLLVAVFMLLARFIKMII